MRLDHQTESLDINLDLKSLSRQSRSGYTHGTIALISLSLSLPLASGDDSE